jgi:tetratricopeptide (TPR) repeat protein
MEALQRANKLNPKDGVTFCEVAFAFIRQGNTEVLDQVWQAALKSDPTLICALAGPYHARPTAKGRPAPKDVLTGLVNRSTDAWEKGFLFATLARVLLAEGDVSGARVAADEALSHAPNHPVAWFANAEVLKKEKQDDKALEAYGKAAELDGAWSGARLAYADALARKGGPALAQAIAQYEAVLLITQNEAELSRVKKLLPQLKKQAAP